MCEKPIHDTYEFCSGVPTIKYFYNTYTGKCEPYTYPLGCDKLPWPRFNTRENCEHICIQKPKMVCELPLMHLVRDCQNPVVKYYHNKGTGKCDAFYDCGFDGYSGFRRNTQEDCEDYCVHRYSI